jgi:tRNA threonylcarbamoyladenosine biosynthesis protein TsaB
MPARSSDRDALARCLLAFDTAGTACSAAVWRDGAVRARRFEVMSRGQSERLVPMIQEVMAEAGVGYPALDAIAVSCGPGGFTGVRIGLATARALALACARPVIGVSNFEAVAAAVPEAARADRILAAVIDAKRSDLYVQAFDADLTPLTSARALAPTELSAFLPGGPLLLAGDAVEMARAALEAAGRDVSAAAAPGQGDGGQADAGQADAIWIAALAAARPLPETGAAPPGPIYLRAPDVTLARPVISGPGSGPGPKPEPVS